LGRDNYVQVNLDARSEEEYRNVIYGSMLAHIKEKPEFKFSCEALAAYQKRIDEILATVMKDSSIKDKLGRAMELLRGPNPKSEDERAKILLNFYERHYLSLFDSFQKFKEITVRIV
jgi:hypothetical protein